MEIEILIVDCKFVEFISDKFMEIKKNVSL